MCQAGDMCGPKKYNSEFTKLNFCWRAKKINTNIGTPWMYGCPSPTFKVQTWSQVYQNHRNLMQEETSQGMEELEEVVVAFKLEKWSLFREETSAFESKCLTTHNKGAIIKWFAFLDLKALGTLRKLWDFLHRPLETTASITPIPKATRWIPQESHHYLFPLSTGMGHVE